MTADHLTVMLPCAPSTPKDRLLIGRFLRLGSSCSYATR
jgi:hypothetical protein